jgi:hypothetical protein
MNEVNNRQVILKVGAEGGSITVWGREASMGRWLFAVGTNESAILELLNDEDAVTFQPPVLRWTDSWEEALERLNSYPWPQLYPLEVHPAFRDRVRDAFQGRHHVGSLANKWDAFLATRKGDSELRIQSKKGTKIRSVDDWKKYAPPKREYQWQDGRSAKKLAKAFFRNGKPRFPEELHAILNGNCPGGSFTIERVVA